MEGVEEEAGDKATDKTTDKTTRDKGNKKPAGASIKLIIILYLLS